MIDVSPELLAFLKEEYDRCEDQTLEDERITAIKRYNGEPYGDEVDGRSQVVARDTAETTDYMAISILRTIVSGERVVEFVHRNTEAADQATETIMHLLMDEQDGYSILHDWLKAGLLEKNAVAMTYGEPRPPKRHKLERVSVLALMAAEQQGLKLAESEETEDIDPETGTPLLNVTLLEERGPKFCDSAIPNEEFYCSPDARTITEAPLKGRKRLRPVHELVAEGFDADELSTVGDGRDNLLAQTRDEDRYADQGARRGGARQVWWHEDYVTFDANGDGIAELLYVRRTGDFKVFSIEEMDDPDDHPFEDWCPFPMQHRRIGQSLADKVMDLERINTVLLRQSLDGIYLSNMPSTYLHEDAIGGTTLEDILTVRPGRVIRWKGQIQPQERQGNFDAGVGFNALEYLERKRESRTGITRLNMGLDDKTLNDTAQGQQQLIQKGEQMEEYVARNFANGLAKLITKKAKLLRRYGQPITVPIDGQYVEVDPSSWPEDMLARVKVGLGASRKETRLAFIRELMGYQSMALEAGLPIVDPKKMFNLGKVFIKESQLGEATEFFNDPEAVETDQAGNPVLGEQGQPKLKHPPQAPPPDPAMAKAQAQIQADQMKMQADGQAKQAEMQMKHQQAQSNLQLKLMEIQGKMALAKEDMQQRAMLEQQKAFVETQLAQQQAQMEAELERMKLAMQARLHAHDAQRRDVESEAKIKTLRKGGRLNK
jgi:hypothetical protein